MEFSDYCALICPARIRRNTEACFNCELMFYSPEELDWETEETCRSLMMDEEWLNDNTSKVECIFGNPPL